MKVCVFDIETTYGSWAGRVGSPWAEECKICSAGWKYSDRGKCSTKLEYFVKSISPVGNMLASHLGYYAPMSYNEGLRPGQYSMPSMDGVQVLIGHNIKFDLMWYWRDPEFMAFLKRGGVIWDTAYAEYLLSGQYYTQNSQPENNIKLASCCVRRALKHQKLDIVAALWDQGIRTEDIDRDVLLEYQEGDIDSALDLFRDQLRQAIKQNQLTQIRSRMEGLLAICEMEYNGMKIHEERAAALQAELEQEIGELSAKLNEYLPELPDKCEFNWNSNQHVSALLFGGSIKYVDKEMVVDEDNKPVYYLKDELRPRIDADGNLMFKKEAHYVPEVDADGNPVLYKSGINKGTQKIKKVMVPTSEQLFTRVSVYDFERGPKMRNAQFEVELPQQIPPKESWKLDSGYYSTDAKTMQTLMDMYPDNSMLGLMKRLGALNKDLGTYYKRFNKGKWTGMLTNIQEDGKVHGSLNAAVTATSRLSSSNPNLQNLSGNEKSKVKSTFVSRFSEQQIEEAADKVIDENSGCMGEIDYSQLEVVTKGTLALDPNYIQDILDGVDWHINWLSLAEDVPYDICRIYCKGDNTHEPLEDWVKKRKHIKPLTFGHAYGASLNTLVKNSGLPADKLEKALTKHKEKYPGLYEFDDSVMASCERTRQPSNQRTPKGFIAGVGYWRSPTNTIYHFMETDSLPFQVDRGIFTSFTPTITKNYPSQGFGGEIMQVQSGRVFRHLLMNDLLDDILLVNNVHDAMYTDCRSVAIAKKYFPKICALLEDVPLFFTAVHGMQTPLPFPVEGTLGDSLYEHHTVIKERDMSWCFTGADDMCYKLITDKWV